MSTPKSFVQASYGQQIPLNMFIPNGQSVCQCLFNEQLTSCRTLDIWCSKSGEQWTSGLSVWETLSSGVECPIGHSGEGAMNTPTPELDSESINIDTCPYTFNTKRTNKTELLNYLPIYRIKSVLYVYLMFSNDWS